MSHPGVAFLDRDGTINRKAADGEYVKQPEEVSLLPGAAPAIRRLNEAGVAVIVVTNQRGIALRQMTEEDLEDVHAELTSRLAVEAGANIDGFFHCPHDIAECDCRKPDTGMFKQALERFPWIELGQSVTVGDSPSDIEAGQALGMKTLQLGFDAADLAAAVDQLLRAPNTRS